MRGIEKAMRKKGRVLYGWRYESLDEKIRHRLSLSLAERYAEGLATGEFARILERNYLRLYGRGGFKRIQVLKQK